jgi:hypothetical protein
MEQGPAALVLSVAIAPQGVALPACSGLRDVYILPGENHSREARPARRPGPQEKTRAINGGGRSATVSPSMRAIRPGRRSTDEHYSRSTHSAPQAQAQESPCHDWPPSKSR